MLAGADTCVAPVLEVSEVAADPQFAAAGCGDGATHPRQGAFGQLAPLLAGMDGRGGHRHYRDPGVTDTEHLLKEAGVDGETVAAWVAKGVVA